MVWALPLLPIVAGVVIATGRPFGRSRGTLTGTSVLVLAATLASAVRAAVTGATATSAWGAGLTLQLATPPTAGVVAVAVPAIALPVVAYAAAHEDRDGLARLVGLLVAFVGAMELLVVAADLLTLVIGWELVGAASWALIGHRWRDPSRPARAAHAYLTTRGADLGLLLAAGAAYAATGSLAYEGLAAIGGTGQHVVVAGIVLAAAAKSAQLPFSPWLFSAMAGPTAVSALLHAATMVAAGAYLLARLEPVVAASGWGGPTVLVLGLVTALVGGVVAVVQTGAKHLLAASTAAQHGLMLVAIGAGYPAIAIAHLVAHAAFKSLLFLTAGTAMGAVGSEQLGRMRLGRSLRTTAVAAGVGSLALAAVPPLGAAWTKEEVVAAAGHLAAPLAVLVVVAGGLSALYATRFQLLAFGPARGDDPPLRDLAHRPGPVEGVAVVALASVSVVLGLLWWPATHGLVERLGGLPSGAPWEVVASLTAVGAGVSTAINADRAGWLGSLGTTGRTRAAADWLGLPILSRRTVADPTLRLAASLARFDDRVVDAVPQVIAAGGRHLAARAGQADDRLVDAGVRGVARGASATSSALAGADVRIVDAAVRRIAGAGQRLATLSTRRSEVGVEGLVRAVTAAVSWAGRDARRLQTGMVHHSLTVITVGAGLAMVLAAFWR